MSFDRPDWLFEVKYDGHFRALAYLEDGIVRLVSRKDHTYKAFEGLCQGIDCGGASWGGSPRWRNRLP